MPKANPHPIYKVWINIKSRCDDPNNPSFRYYGGRGITVCSRWRGPDGFHAFLQDMGPKPTPQHTIDRIDSNRDYEPGNCRWATPKQQASNRRSNHLVCLADGRVMTLTQAAELCGKDRTTLARHLAKGRSIEHAMIRHR